MAQTTPDASNERTQPVAALLSSRRPSMAIGGGRGVLARLIAGAPDGPSQDSTVRGYSPSDFLVIGGWQADRLSDFEISTDVTESDGFWAKVGRTVLQLWRVFACTAWPRQVIDVLAFGPSPLAPILNFVPRIRTWAIVQNRGGLHNELLRSKRVSAISYFWTRSYEWASLRFADRIVFPSDAGRLWYCEENPAWNDWLERKTEIVWNGVPPVPDDEIIAAEPPVVLNVASHVPEKRIDVALRIFAEAAKQVPDLRFVNIGMTGSETGALLTASADLEIENRCAFLGKLDAREVNEWMGRACVLLHTPERSVFDLVVLEAMAHGLPMLVPFEQGIREALGDEYVFRFNDISEAVAMLISVLRDPSTQRDISVWLRDRHRRLFSAEEMYKRYMGLLVEVKQA